MTKAKLELARRGIKRADEVTSNVVAVVRGDLTDRVVNQREGLSQQLQDALAREQHVHILSVEHMQRLVEGGIAAICSRPDQAHHVAVRRNTAARNAVAAFERDLLVRKEVELHAQRLAENYFRERGWRVEDVHRRESFDFIASKGHQSLYVEAKGTQRDGRRVLLTAAEVRFARSHPSESVLAVVKEIRVESRYAPVRCSGGRLKLVRPWNPRDDALRPTAYSYAVP
jgi:hypothetical protein